MAERDRSETMMERILAYKHSTEQMKKEMLKLIESEAAANAVALKFATRVSQIATEEMNPALKHLMRSLAASLNEAESFRKRYAVDRLAGTVVDSMTMLVDASLKPALEMTKDRAKTKKDLRDANSRHQAALRSDAQSTKTLKAARTLKEQQARFRNVDDLFMKNCNLFETDRLAVAKEMYREIIHAQLGYHCAAVQSLSHAARLVAELDPDAEATKLDNLLAELD